METYKNGDKVLLYSLEECKLKPWYYQHYNHSFCIRIYDGFQTHLINNIVHDMMNYLGSIQIIQNLNTIGFNINESAYVWPVQLIKEKIS